MSIWGAVASFLGSETALRFIPKPIKILFSCLCCFDSNIITLNAVAENLDAERGSLQMKVNAAECNAQVVDRKVEIWLNKVEENQRKKTDIDTQTSTEQNAGLTAISRFSFTEKVKETTEAMEELLQQSCKFNTIAHRPPPAAWVSAPLESTFQFFDSRKHVEEVVMTSLRDNGTYKVAICGMGGVGKTTMANMIMHRVREEDLFQEILMVVVTQKVDILRIQNDIAKKLGMNLTNEDDIPHRLRTRLSGSTRKSLVVLDDVWKPEDLKLDDLGIPCHSGCKVLITSRNADILNNLKVEKIHNMKVLSKTEAWHLFKSNVGSCIDHPGVVSVAQQVAAECNGLPVALVTVGAALKNTEKIGVWKDWLDQLKSGNPIDLPKVLDGVYRPLRSSYEFLNNERAQALFLMCCLYAEDANIPIEELAIYAKGLHMLGGIKSLEEARNRVCALVEMLKSRFLLLEGISKDHVKMQDVIRDVAIFIASEKKLITHDSKTNDCTWISPNIGERIELHAGLTIFPNLRLLWIDRESRDKELEIDDQFFEGMKQLNVFSIRCRSLQQLPQTTRILDNLQTLVLEWCVSLESMSVVGELVNLEILICYCCNSIKSLPIEIGRLRRLRLLKLSYCKNLKTIAPGIISNLKGLEELIIEGSFDEWEAENTEKEKKNASLSELEKLSSLSRLKIEIKDSTLAAQQMQLSPNLVGYHIRIGDERWYSDKSELYEKKMELALPVNINLGNWIDKCVGSAEFLYLEGDGSSMVLGVAQNVRVLDFKKCSTVKKLVSRKSTATIFPLLEVLELHELSELKEICDIDAQMPSNFLSNLKELRFTRLPALEHLNIVSNFNKLSSIYVSKCDRLQSLFSSLPPLERLEIYRCDMMEQVLLWNHGENQMPLVLPKLKSLTLENMPKLMSFIKGEGIKSIEFPVLEEIEVKRCPLKNFVFTTSSTSDAIHMLCNHDKIKFDCLGKLKFDYRNDEMGRIWCPQISLKYFYRLRVLRVSGFKGLKSLFSLSTIESNCLLQLELLEISNCDMMEEVILWNDKEINNRITPFPKLKLLKLSHLPRLMSFSHGFEIIEFPMLEKIEITNCDMMEELILWNEEETNNRITPFQKLKFLKLSHLPRLTRFSQGIESIEFPVLEEVQVEDCPTKSFVFTGSSTRCPNYDDDAIHLFCKPDKVKFDNLSKLQLRCGNDMRIWCPQIPHDFFARLRELKIKGFNSMKTLFSLSTIKSGCFSQLEKLKISECEMMEEVILWDEEENRTNIHITLFPKLKLLSLYSLPRLTSLSKGIQFTPPAEMRINNCPLLESCASTTSSDDNDDFIHLFCKTRKVEFSSLKKLKIVGYDGTRRNWCPQLPMIDIFSGLSKLSIIDVNGVKSLFSCSVARNLHNMKVLYICWCEEMVKVIEDDACGGETSPFHLFPNLEKLDLYELTKLKSFCEWRCALEFPLLKTLKISRCKLMEKFTSGPLHTPILKDIETEDIYIKGRLSSINVNAFLQQRRLKRGREKAIGGELC